MERKHRHYGSEEATVSSESPLFEVVQDGYRLFKQGRTDHAVCDCCMDTKTRKEFFSFSQAELPLEYLNQWFDAAAETPMPKAAWRFVLPRIMEVLASGEDPSRIGPEVALHRFETGKPEHWTTEEWNVLDMFQRLMLRHIELRNEDCLDDIVCMFASAGWNPEDLFSQILELPTDLLVRKLWSDWCEHHYPSIWVSAFWRDESQAWKFYGSQELLEKVSNFALSENTAPDLAEKAMAVADTIFMKKAP